MNSFSSDEELIKPNCLNVLVWPSYWQDCTFNCKAVAGLALAFRKPLCSLLLGSFHQERVFRVSHWGWIHSSYPNKWSWSLNVAYPDITNYFWCLLPLGFLCDYIYFTKKITYLNEVSFERAETLELDYAQISSLLTSTMALDKSQFSSAVIWR